MPSPNKGESEQDFVSRCMAYPDMQKYDEKQRAAICYSKYRDKKEVYRHRDFQRIHDEFTAYYKDPQKGDSEYYDWLHALNADEFQAYRNCLESFQWAKDMISLLREDQDNKYYRILVGFPITSMNENVYQERDLIAASLDLAGAHPNLNHKSEFWFSPENPMNTWGTLTVTAAKFEDRAVEAILQVPKTAVCPICNGRKMTELIDEKKIVNVSLEGGCALQVDNPMGQHECHGFRFNKKGFSLLTSDILPGIPMARIKPLESIMVEALQANETRKTPLGEKKSTQIIKLELKEATNYGKTYEDHMAMCTKDGHSMEECKQMWTKEAFNQPPPSTTITTTVNQPPLDKTPFNPTQPTSKPEVQDYSLPINVTVQNTAGETKAGKSPADGTNELRGFQTHEKLAFSEEKLARIKAESRARGLEEQIATLEKDNATLEKANSELSGRSIEQASTIKRLDSQKETLVAELRTSHRLQDETANELALLKAECEKLHKNYSELNPKYEKMMTANLDLTKKLTTANEDYLNIAKENETLKEALEKAKINAKKTIRIQA